MAQTGLEFKLQEMAGRIRTLREIVELTPAKMAEKTGVSVEEYLRCEQGREDLNFAFLYRCALALGVDVTDIIEGSSRSFRAIWSRAAAKGSALSTRTG